MRDEINAALREAQKSQDKRRISTLRLINAAIQDRDIAERGHGRAAASDDAIRELLAKMIKQRQESVRLYDVGARPELAEQEREEITIIQSFLPEQLGEEEMRAAISDIIEEIGASSPKDMGKVMSALKASYAGRMDFAQVSQFVKEALQR